MATGGNFDDKLTLIKNPDGRPTVDARVPRYGRIKNISVWITQPNGENDAAAAGTEGPSGGGTLIDVPSDPGGDEEKWSLLATPATEDPLEEGPAFAMAIAMFVTTPDRKQKVRLWAQPVELVMAPEDPLAPEGQTSTTDADGT